MSTSSTDILIGNKSTTSAANTPEAINTSSVQSIPNATLLAAEAKASAKRSAFDQEVQALIKQAQDTIVSKYPDEVVRQLKPPSELVSLNRYNTIYSSMDPVEHYKYFETIYNRKRIDILQCLKGDASKGERYLDDRWIRTSNLVVQFGEGVKAPSREIEEKRKLVRLMLSDIYLIAADLQRQAEEAMSELSDISPNVDGKDLIRTNILMLHLMRIFYHLNDGNDKKIIGDIVTFLETELGVTKRTVGTPTVVATAVASALGSAPTTGGLSSLFTMATNMMEQFGLKPPAGLKPPTEQEITNVMTNVFSNEATQNALKSVITGLNGTQDFGSAIQKAVASVTDPATLAAIQGSVSNMSQQAMGSHNVAQNSMLASNTANTTPQNFEVPYKE